MVGAVAVPGATVTAFRGDTTLVTTTDGQGNYRFADLTDGSWMLRVEMTGFASIEREINIGSDLPPSTWQLELRSFSELAIAIESRPAQEERRDRAAAAGLAGTPGLRTSPTLNATPVATIDSGREGGTVIDLAPEATDGLLINGSVNNAAASLFAQLAAFGNNRPGRGWRYTGGAGAVLGHSAWDARPYSFSATQTPKPSYSDVHLVGNLGGPLGIPHLLASGPDVFIGFQHNTDHSTHTVPAVVPTAAERLGDFSQTIDSIGRPVEPIDPRTGVPFPGRLIPRDRIDPAASSLLAHYPVPNLHDTADINYQAALDTVVRQSVIQARITQPSSRRTQWRGNFTYQKTSTEAANLFGFVDEGRLSGIDTGVTWARRFSPRLSMRAAYQFTRTTRDTVPYFANRANVSGEAGIVGNAQDPLNWGPPSLAFTSIEALTGASYALERTIKHAWSAESVLHRGRHAITLGGDVRRNAVDLQTPQDPRGTFSFDGSTSGADLADFLLGLPHAASIGNAQAARFRATVLDAYVNDDWRPAVGLTVTAGVRWEYESPMTEREGRLVNLDIVAGFGDVSPVIATRPIGPLTGRRYPSSLLFPDRGDIQPRLGVSWRPRPQSSMVIRGGYGLYRSTNVYQSLAALMTQQPPLSNTFTVDATASQPLTLATGFLATLPAVHNTFAVDPDLRVGIVQSWQASMQRDLPASLTMSVLYLGTRGSRLMQEILPNTYPTGGVNPCASCPTGFVYLTSSGRSLRHAAHLQLRRRLRNGLTATAQYTLAKAMDDAAAIGGVNTRGNAIVQDWQHPDREWARSAFDQRHLFTLQVQYSTGVGIAGGGLLDGVKATLWNGWTFTSQVTAGSGLPFTPVYLTSVEGTGIIGTLRPNLDASPQPVSEHAYLNPASFSAPVAGQWGTAPRNAVSGPAQFSLNAGATRTFTLTDRLSLDWRVDAANVLNRVTFASVNAIFGHPQFGQPNRANTMRALTTTIRLRF
jgi:hypothetical protein